MMKRQKHIALLILLLLLPGIAGNVTLHACWVSVTADCCETETADCCDAMELQACAEPGCTSCDAVSASSDGCECSSCHVTLPGADIKATIPSSSKPGMDEAPAVLLAAVAALNAPSVPLYSYNDPSPPVFQGISSTVLLI